MVQDITQDTPEPIPSSDISEEIPSQEALPQEVTIQETSLEETPDLVSQEDTSTENVSTVDAVIEKCNNECKTDAQSYCLEKKEVIFSSETIRFGTCRSFAKYNSQFQKCEWFCEQFWNNKWPESYCTDEKWWVDSTCGN